jgi:hypothetical protein
MGAPEEAGKVATSAIEALKAAPSCLAALLLCAMFIALSYFNNQREAERKAKTLDIVMERCFPRPEGPQNPR